MVKIKRVYAGTVAVAARRSQFVDDCANDHSMKGYEDKEVSYAHKGA